MAGIRVFVVAWGGAVALLAALAAPCPADAQQPPRDARPLSAVELYDLYRDTTWPWESGAAHFFDEGRRFIAWSADDTGLSHAEGRYELTDRGSMCLVGRWTGLDYPTGQRYAPLVRSCFRHVTDGETVFQRPATGGPWSAFAGPGAAPPALRASDGAEVAERIAEVEAALERLRGARPVPAWVLLDLYGDRTWLWEAGGVRFTAADRSFVAYSDDDDGRAIGEGRFQLMDDGRLCLDGAWTGVDLATGGSYEAPARPCFRHLQAGGSIYRAPVGSAEWVLLGPRGAPGEIADLIEEDTVSPRVETLRPTLAPWGAVTE